MTIDQQLKLGIRYFDIRAGFSKQASFPRLAAHPSQFVIISPTDFTSELSIESIFTKLRELLRHRDHARECLIVQIKQDREQSDDLKVAEFAGALCSLFGQFEDNWCLESSVPTVGKLRGRIQLVRRFDWPTSLRGNPGGIPGINAFREWNENDNNDRGFQIHNTGSDLFIQDHWKIKLQPDTPGMKFMFVKEHLQKAKGDVELKNWYINFASAVCPWRAQDARDLAIGYTSLICEPVDGVNVKVSHFFNNAPSGRYGTILLDYPEEPAEMLLAMIKTNFSAFNL